MVLNADLNWRGDLSHSLIHTQHTFSFQCTVTGPLFPSFSLSLSLSIIREIFLNPKSPESLPLPLSVPTYIYPRPHQYECPCVISVCVHLCNPHLLFLFRLLSQLSCSVSLRTLRYPVVSIGRRGRTKLLLSAESRASQMCDPAEQNSSMLAILNRVIKRVNARFHQRCFLSLIPLLC